MHPVSTGELPDPRTNAAPPAQGPREEYTGRAASRWAVHSVEISE